MEEEIVLRVDMHCEGCAKKVAKALRGFEGIIIVIFIFLIYHYLLISLLFILNMIFFFNHASFICVGVEEVKTDSKARLVVVKGKTADPIKVYERVQTKTGRRTELISPILKEPEEEKKEEAVDPPQEEKKEEVP